MDNEKAGEIEVVKNIAETIDTSQSAGAEEVKGEMESSINFGKFKSASELLNAYNSLESEFTRRCQKTKELEREIERLNLAKQTETDLAKSAVQRGTKAFKEKFPEAEELMPSLYKIAADNEDDAEGWLERAYVNYLKGEIKRQRDEYSSDEYLLKKAESSSALKDGIIREYLGSINGSKPKARLLSGDGGAIVTPPSKPKNFYEAGELAKIIFEKSKEI